ncbi:MAG: starvation-inducible outer membrane lipoprotein [Bacteroidia bacterium]|jgi:starvation-inducible outer membrane lipoprotein
MRRLNALLISTLTLVCLLGTSLAPLAVQARSNAVAEQGGGLTAKQAAARAKAQYGGKVLKVTRQGKDYRVRLLQKSGRVLTVVIRG